MRKMKKLAKRVVAFSMAALLTCSGFLDNLTIGARNLTGNVSGVVNAEAATVTGTVNADTFSWDNATVYFLLTDRFKNGNTSNDHSYNRGLDKNGNVVNIDDDRATFHGGDFAGVTDAIEEGYFNDLGVNAIWISAPYEQIHGYIVGSDDSPSYAHYSYHGYYVLDYTQTDANFGTAEEFKTLVDTAHEHGIRVIIDVVLNHAGYNSLYDMNEYGFGAVKSGWDSFYYAHSGITNSVYHSYIDYEADSAAWGKWWGADWVRAGLPGYTEGGGDSYTMSLAGLPDFKTESTSTVDIPTVLKTKWTEEGRYDEEVAELKNYLSSNGYAMTVTNCISYWLSTWVREYGVDGFRCDTAKHVENSSWAVLEEMCTDALKEWKANNPDKALDDLDFWMTGEAWDHGVSYDAYYTAGHFDSMINFDTWGGGVLSSGTVAGKYEDYAGAVNTKEDFNILSFMSSHDSLLTRGDQIYLGSAFLMLPGGVQIYYGDETNRPLVEGVDFDGSGGAGHSLRSDMNWDSIDEEVLAHWQKVGTFRNNHIAVGAGTHTTVSASSGVGFTRTYSKNGITDRVAAVIGASSNASVTIDVSGVWDDGSVVTNYYDNSSATVTNGKVTFNSGANGTILVGDPDGKPLVSVTGNAKFKGTQTVTININEADYAIVSVDGAHKFIAYDGDTFEIGKTAYEGDTVSVSYQATNEKGTINGKTTFYKAYADEELEDPDEPDDPVQAKVRVKMSDGSAPYLYAWESTSTALAGTWPGTLLTQKDSEGYYYMELDTTGTYNVIFNNGSAQTADITGLSGETTFEVASGFGSYKQTGGTVVVPSVNNTITIKVKPYSSSQVPYLYVWSGDTALNGGFPGKQLTEKDDDGNYVFTVDGYSTAGCIVSGGSNQNQSGNITGITGTALITVNSADYSEYDVEKSAPVESKFALMKKEARAIKNMTSSDYTKASWDALYAYVDDADALVALGEENADTTAVTDLYNKIVAAKKALVLAAPKVTTASSGSKVVKGTAAAGATVTITIAGKTYTATADEVTDVWTVNASSNLTTSSTITTSATRDGLSSVTGSYSLSGGNIDEPDDPITELSATLKVNGSSSAVNLTVGDSVTVVPTATGGSGSYTYKYVIKNVSTGATAILKSYSSETTYTGTMTSAGTKQFIVYVKDSNGTEVCTNAVTVVTSKEAEELSATLKVNNSSSTINLTVGDTVTVKPTVTGGSGSYTYKYVIKNVSTGATATLKNYSSTTSYTGTMTSAGTKQFIVYVKDSDGTIVTTNAVTVVTSKEVEELSATLKVNNSSSTINLTVGDTVTVKPTATGGSGSYTYKYVIKNVSTGATATLKNYSSTTSYTGTMTSVGTKQFIVYVKDSNGTVVQTNAVTVVTSEESNELSATLKVNNTTSQLNLAVGDVVVLKPTATGGSGSYTYKYVVKNVATGSEYTLKSYSSSTTYTGEMTGTGTKDFIVYVKDSNGTIVASNSVRVVVS